MNIEELNKIIEEKIESYHPKGDLDKTSKFFLSMARINHKKVVEHVQRVALLAEECANRLKMDMKACFFAGLFHDVGKVILPYDLFSGRDITDEEYKLVREHARMGFEILQGTHLFIALCAGAHHALSRKGYGIERKDFPENWELVTIQKVLNISSLLSICDFVDAYNTRETKMKDSPAQPFFPNLEKMLKDRYTEQHLYVETVLSVWSDLFGVKEQV